MGRTILGTCRNDLCEVSGGLILLGEAYDISPVIVAGKPHTDLYHRECNPNADHSKD